MKNDFCIIYIATGEKYRSECLKSVKSAKAVMPDIPIILWTDSSYSKSDETGNWFDDINIIDNPQFSLFDKILPLTKTSYKKNIFLDTDTYVLHSFYEISDLLERFDMAFCHAPVRIPYKGYINQEIPICFPQPNTGVIAFNHNQDTVRLFREWENIYDYQLKNEFPPPAQDQPAFQKALYFSDIHFTILPSEYNTRTVYPIFKGGNSFAKILHGRGFNLENAIKNINNSYKYVELYDFRKSKANRSKIQKLKSKIKQIYKTFSSQE